MEEGESDCEALVRECREELGVEVEPGEPVWRTHHAYADLEVELILLAATIRSGEPHPLGAQKVRYASVDEMAGLPFCEADLPLLERLQQEKQ